MRELLAFMKNMQRILGLTIQEVVKATDLIDVYVFRNKAKICEAYRF